MMPCFAGWWWSPGRLLSLLLGAMLLGFALAVGLVAALVGVLL